MLSQERKEELIALLEQIKDAAIQLHTYVESSSVTEEEYNGYDHMHDKLLFLLSGLEDEIS